MARPREASKGGLILINTTPFSSTSSLSFNNVFNSTYDNYRVICRIDSTADIQIRFRASGTDNSTTSSYKQYRTYNPYGTPVVPTESLSFFYCGYYDANGGGFSMDVLSPFLAKRTNFSWTAADGNYAQSGIGIHTVSSSMDGFTIFGPTSSGTISIYGYRK